MGAYDRDGGGGALPPDLEIDSDKAAESAASTSANSYTKTIRMAPVVGKTYKFWFTYLYEDPETKKISESENSPVFTTTFAIENETKPVKNLTLTQGFKSYGVKFDIDPESVQSDIVIYESLTGAFAGEEYIVYVGTSTNVSINTSDYSPRWVKVVTRDNWLDANRSSVTAGPITPKNAEVDTTTAPAAPTNVFVVGSIDSDDLSGFSAKITATWTASTDTNTNGYVIRWSSQNPATVPSPVWEYGQVDGRETNTFAITGLTPNTLYYWQVTAKSPYNAISWSSPQSGTVGPIVDPDAPADVWTQLKSVISIGGQTADLFKIGTGISQSINTSTTITPSQTPGTYSGIILNRSTTNYGHNYWLNTGQFRVGGPSSFLYWDGSDLYTTGKINATGGTFTGNLRVTTGSIISGGTFASDGTVSGARVVIQPSGLFAHDASGAQIIAIQSSDGKIDARKGYIGGWTIDGTAQTIGSIYSSNTKLESNGTITLGDTTGTLSSIVRLSATDPNYRIWIGSQQGNNAKFKVGLDGTLYASNAVLSVSSGGVYDSIIAAQDAANAASEKATEAKNDASSALTTVDGKNSIFRTGSTPSALKAGDIWINSNDGNKLYVAEYAGTGGWQLSQDASIAVAVSRADDALDKATTAVNTANNAYPASNFSKSAILQAINASSNGDKLNGQVLEAGTVVADNVVSTYVYAGYINADMINAGMLSGRDINLAGDSSSNRLRTSYMRNTPANNTLGRDREIWGISSLGVNAIAFVSASTSGVVSHWYPWTEEGNYLGLSSIRWQGVYAITSTIQTSDSREKTDIENSDLGLDFIKSLRPTKYKRVYTAKIPKMNGDEVVIDEDGNRVIDREEVRYGDRYYYGFIAQEVKESLDEFGVQDTFAGWTLDDKDDPLSRQGLRYEEFIGPMAKAIQELSDMVESLQQEVNTLKGI
jgi:hypothetical protein